MAALTYEQAVEAFTKSAWQGPVAGVNLLKFRQEAQYPDDSFEPCTGLEAWLKYEELALKLAVKYNLKPLFRGMVDQTFFGAHDEEWDALIINGYDEKQDLIAALADDELNALGVHVGAAIEKYTFLACRPDSL